MCVIDWVRNYIAQIISINGATVVLQAGGIVVVCCNISARAYDTAINSEHNAHIHCELWSAHIVWLQKQSFTRTSENSKKAIQESSIFNEAAALFN